MVKALWRVYFVGDSVPDEPVQKRVAVFVDGQNLYHAAKEVFAYNFPNYDVMALAQTLCRHQGWSLQQTRFYTGVPAKEDNAFWNHFWIAKMAAMGRQGVIVFSRPLRYRYRKLHLPDGTEYSVLSGEEKGIDVLIAIDMIRLAHRQEYDVALVFSQDQDLSEVAKELRILAREQRRWLKVASAFPGGITARNRRGIEATDWISIDKDTYDACLDSRDYRPPR